MVSGDPSQPPGVVGADAEENRLRAGMLWFGFKRPPPVTWQPPTAIEVDVRRREGQVTANRQMVLEQLTAAYNNAKKEKQAVSIFTHGTHWQAKFNDPEFAKACYYEHRWNYLDQRVTVIGLPFMGIGADGAPMSVLALRNEAGEELALTGARWGRNADQTTLSYILVDLGAFGWVVEAQGYAENRPHTDRWQLTVEGSPPYHG